MVILLIKVKINDVVVIEDFIFVIKKIDFLLQEFIKNWSEFLYREREMGFFWVFWFIYILI